MNMTINQYNTREQAAEALQFGEITTYVDTGGWGFYKRIHRTNASQNELIAYDTNYSVIDQQNGYGLKHGLQFETMKDLQAAMSSEYQDAADIAKADYKCIRPEPYLLMTKDDERYGDPHWYNGKLTMRLINWILEENPEIDELWYQNDIDGADSLRAFVDAFPDDDYTPSVATAEVLIWRK